MSAAGATSPTLTTVAMGRDALEAIRDGRLDPPAAAALVDLRLHTVEDGHTVFRFQPSTQFDNGDGAVNGGILATVADFALSTAVMTMLPAGALVVTSNLNVSFLHRVASTGDALTCEGRAIHLGRQLAHAEATLTDRDGGVCLRASATCYVRRPRARS
jgi:uncharacterized protein (TIGR00369 family)